MNYFAGAKLARHNRDGLKLLGPVVAARYNERQEIVMHTGVPRGILHCPAPVPQKSRTHDDGYRIPVSFPAGRLYIFKYYIIYIKIFKKVPNTKKHQLGCIFVLGMW